MSATKKRKILIIIYPVPKVQIIMFMKKYPPPIPKLHFPDAVYRSKKRKPPRLYSTPNMLNVCKRPEGPRDESPGMRVTKREKRQEW